MDAENALHTVIGLGVGDQPRGIPGWDSLCSIGDWWGLYSRTLIVDRRPTEQGWRLLRAALSACLATAQATNTVPGPVAVWLRSLVVTIGPKDVAPSSTEHAFLCVLFRTVWRGGRRRCV